MVGITKASSPPTLFKSQSVIAKSIFSFSKILLSLETFFTGSLLMPAPL